MTRLKLSYLGYIMRTRKSVENAVMLEVERKRTVNQQQVMVIMGTPLKN